MAIIEYVGKIKQIDNLTPTVRHFKITLDKEMDFKAGQFVNLSFEDDNEIFLRPYSICSNPINKKEVEFCIKLIEAGKVTPHLWKKKEGDIVKIKGPFGLFTYDNVQKETLVFIGTGTGIAPLRSMILDIIEKQIEKKIILIFATKFENEILYKQDFINLEKENPNFHYYPIVSRPTKNYHGRIGYVQQNLDMIDIDCEIYICGLKAMVDGAAEKLYQMGISKELIHHEKF